MGLRSTSAPRPPATSGAGVRAGHCVPDQQALHQERPAHAAHTGEALCVPDAAGAGAHPPHGRLPQASGAGGQALQQARAAGAKRSLGFLCQSDGWSGHEWAGKRTTAGIVRPRRVAGTWQRELAERADQLTENYYRRWAGRPAWGCQVAAGRQLGMVFASRGSFQEQCTDPQPTMFASHRDIKPQNLLVNINTHALKLCDFGSAKALIRGEPNISYICSRYYRAPELIFGAVNYTVAIDVSAVGQQGWRGPRLLCRAVEAPRAGGVEGHGGRFGQQLLVVQACRGRKLLPVKDGSSRALIVGAPSSGRLQQQRTDCSGAAGVRLWRLLLLQSCTGCFAAAAGCQHQLSASADRALSRVTGCRYGAWGA